MYGNGRRRVEVVIVDCGYFILSIDDRSAEENQNE